MLRMRFALQIIVAITILAVVSGCGVLGANPTVAPTEDPVLLQATLDQAKTQAVQTVVAELTANAPVATNTLAPSETLPTSPVSPRCLPPQPGLSC